MRVRGHAWMVVTTLCALAILLAGCQQVRGEPSSHGLQAVVLAATAKETRLVVVDLGTFAVSRSVRLRSLVTDIDFEPESGLVVAAQTGGIGERADRAVSVTDPDTGVTDYVPLDVPDPTSVVCLDGRAYALHSVVTPEGLVCSVVDVAARRLSSTGRAPDGPGVWAGAHGDLWSARTTSDGSRAVRLQVPSLDVEQEVPSRRIEVSGIAASSSGTVLLGSAPGRADVATAILIAPDGSVAATTAIPSLRYPARIAVEVSGTLVVGDWSGEMPEPSRLALLDATTLRSLGAIGVDGVPCAIAADSGRLLVVERTRGRLLELDAGTGAVKRSVALGARDLLVSEILVTGGKGAVAGR